MIESVLRWLQQRHVQGVCTVDKQLGVDLEEAQDLAGLQVEVDIEEARPGRQAGNRGHLPQQAHRNVAWPMRRRYLLHPCSPYASRTSPTSG